MSNTSITVPDKSSLALEVATCTSVTSEVQTIAEYHQSAEYLRGIKALDAKVHETFDPILDTIKTLSSQVRETRDELLRPLTAARESLISGRDLFEREQERIKAIAEAENARIARETREAEQEALEAMGLGDSSDPGPAVFMTPVLPALPKSQGVSGRPGYSVQVEDFKALVMAVAAGTEPLESLLPNEPFLNSRARASKGRVKIPGVKILCRKITSVRK